ncbi:MAG: hypothetical protein ACOCP4_02715 [Candidatus Woesearchaeota archaeon]
MNKKSIFPQELADALKKANKSIQVLLKIMPEYLVELANLGWFISLDLTPRETSEIFSKLEEKNYQAIDNYMVSYVEEKIQRIEKEIIEAFPKRREPLKAGFRAFKKGEYYLAIPVFLAQIDGICVDSFDQHFFTSNERRKEKTRGKYSVLNSNSVLNAFFEPTGRKIEISKGKKEQHVRNKLIFNRHEIMHGIDNHYGNKINCLKAISLLDYISDITRSKRYFREIKKEK